MMRMSKIENVALAPNTLRDADLTETYNVIEALGNYKITILMEDFFKDLLSRERIMDSKADLAFLPKADMLKNADFIIALGGDGTIIELAVDSATYSVPIVGINIGTLGFLAQAERGDTSIIDKIFAGKYRIDECMMLDVCVIRDGIERCKHIALNDMVISGDEYKMLNVSADVNNVNMAQYSADGLIVATATGSTAYSLSAGGAVMYPDLDAMIVTPICPHTLKSRSTVIPGSSLVSICTVPPYRTDAVVRVDGKIVCKLHEDEYINITKSQRSTLLIKDESANFFDVLRRKLSD